MRLLSCFFCILGVALSTSYAQINHVASFAETSGPVGTIITVHGSGFNSEPTDNVVYLGAVKAEVLSAAVNEITLRVPVGASSVTPITIANLITQKVASSFTI